MIIEFSEQQVNLIRSFVEPVNVQHFSEDCEPPGFSIEIHFAGPYGQFAKVKCGNEKVDLGEVNVCPIQGGWTIS